jgi:hypothetical protein
MNCQLLVVTNNTWIAYRNIICMKNVVHIITLKILDIYACDTTHGGIKYQFHPIISFAKPLNH